MKHFFIFVKCILYAIVMIISVVMIGTVVSDYVKYYCDDSSGKGSLFVEVLFFGILLVVCSVLFFKNIKVDRCSKCKKLFALNMTGEKCIKEEQILKIKEVKTYNNAHEVTGTQEQYLPATRKYYEISYMCKNCGEKFYRKENREYFNI